MIEGLGTLQTYSGSSSSRTRGGDAVSAVVAAAAAKGGGDHLEYVTSRIRVDSLQNVAILEYRSFDTGEILRQYPTEGQIQAFKRAQALEKTGDVPAAVGQNLSVSVPEPASGGASSAIASTPVPNMAGSGISVVV